MVSSHGPSINPYGPSRRSPLRRLLGSVAGAILRPLLARLLHYEKMRQWVIQRMSDHYAMVGASFDLHLPRAGQRIGGFEDLSWLFSSNKLNHGVIRHCIDQAAYLYRLVRSVQHPFVAELGRYKGGGTFLMAAAGARVLSIDNGALGGGADYDGPLRRALAQYRLMGQVQLETADALHYPCDGQSCDLVVVDFPHSRQDAEAAFEHWWPAVKIGGMLLMVDGQDSPLLGVVDFVARLDIAKHGGVRLPDAPGSFVVFQKVDGQT